MKIKPDRKEIENKIRKELIAFNEKIEEIEFLHRQFNVLAVAIISKWTDYTVRVVNYEKEKEEVKKILTKSKRVTGFLNCSEAKEIYEDIKNVFFDNEYLSFQVINLRDSNKKLENRNQELLRSLIKSKQEEININKKIKECKNFAKLETELEDLKKEGIRNILLIGEESKGKSTLANVLCGSEKFHENHHGMRFKEIKVDEFDVEDGRYRVIDTAGISPDCIKNRFRESLSSDLSELTKLIERGINQVFLVIDSGSLPDNKWIELYRLLNPVIFDDEINDYITVVRTKFPNFKNKGSCNIERDLIRSKLRESGIKIPNEKIILVDNPVRDKDTRMYSQRLLRNYLKEHQGIYRPRNLNKLNEIITTGDNEIKKYYTQEESDKIIKQASKVNKVIGGEIIKIGTSTVGLITAILGLAASAASCQIM